MAKEVVLFGGTFDPIHFGHLITARAVGERCGFRRITLVPTASPPHKRQPQATGPHRLEMLELAVGDDPLFEICRFELDRPGPSYTIETLTGLRREHGEDAELRWVIGADMLEGLPTWHAVKEVLAMAQIIVAARPPWGERLAKILTDLRGRIEPDQLAQIEESIVSTPLIDIASKDIRRRVAEGRTIRYLVPNAVRTYIEKCELYR